MYDFEQNHRFLKLTIEIVFSIVQLKKSEPDGSYPVAIILCLDACCVKQIIAERAGLDPFSPYNSLGNCIISRLNETNETL